MADMTPSHRESGTERGAVAARRRFTELHAEGVFALPNPWDIGSARLLEHAGAVALATTSSGFAAARGRLDYGIVRDELVDHVAAVAGAVTVPVTVDGEDGFPDAIGGVAETVRALHDAGAAGMSVEDWDGAAQTMVPIGAATEAVAEAVEAARGAAGGETPMVVTARCEHLLYGHDDLDEIIARLVAYRDAGAGCLYAPGLGSLDAVRTVADAVAAPLNVLGVLVAGATVASLGEAGARRVSVGGVLASVAYGSALRSARALLDDGAFDLDGMLHGDDQAAAFDAPSPG